MQISWAVEGFGIRDGRNFRGIVKTSICRIKTRARVNTSGTTGDTRMRGGSADRVWST